MFSAFQSNSFQRNAFQILTQIAKKLFPEAGGKGSSKKRKKRVYVEREGKIYVFADQYQAEAFTLAQQEETKPEKRKSKAKKAELVEFKPLDKIDIGSIEQLAVKYDKIKQIGELISKSNYDELVYQYRLLLSFDIKNKLRAAEEEEELTILLMAT